MKYDYNWEFGNKGKVFKKSIELEIKYKDVRIGIRKGRKNQLTNNDMQFNIKTHCTKTIEKVVYVFIICPFYWWVYMWQRRKI